MIFADAINYAHDLVVECGKLDLPHKMEAHNAIDRIEAAYKSDLKRSNEQYQHLVNVKSCEWDDNRKPDLITMCERLHRAIKDERTAAFAAQAAYATRREIEDSIVDLVSAIIETRIQKEEKNGCEGK